MARMAYIGPIGSIGAGMEDWNILLCGLLVPIVCGWYDKHREAVTLSIESVPRVNRV